MKVRAHSTCELNGAADRLAEDHRRLREAEEVFRDAPRGLRYAHWAVDDEEKGCAESDASLVENLRTFAGSRATRDQWDSRKRARIMREAQLVPNCTSTVLARFGSPAAC